MESKRVAKDGQVAEEVLKSMDKNVESTEENDLSNILIKRLEPQNLLVLNRSNSCSVEFGDHKLFVNNVRGLDEKLPRHITTFDERYLIRCLELIHDDASRVSSCNFSSKMGILSHNLNSQAISNGTMCDMTGFVTRANDNIVLNSTGDGIVGAITGSRSMANILNSTLLVKLGALDYDVNSRKTNLDIKNKEPSYSDSVSSFGDFSISSSHKLQREMTRGYNGYKSKPVHRKLISMSSTNSTCSDQSSSSSSSVATAISQGMLQITWKNGLPHYVFSTDGNKEVYVADLVKVNSSDDKFLDYVYIFHSRSVTKQDDGEPNIVGKMTVSTSDMSQILETQFVLYGFGDDMQTTSHTLRKNKRLAKKVVDTFKQKSLYKFSGTTTIHEENPMTETCNFDAETLFLPNFELAAIVVREQHVHNSPKKAEIGGWGLKFLKKTRKDASLETSRYPSCSNGECSTTTDVIVPAGIHGGPRTRNGGPSSLLERWSSGGNCDCGGWDVGCPLKILNTRQNKTESLSETSVSEDCKTIDLFIQGSNQGVPTMKMANIHNGLYYIHFQSTMLSLQSFGIATAIIHSRSPILRSKLYRR